MKINKEQRKILAKIFGDLPVVTYLSMIIGQFVNPLKFKPVIFIVGILLFSFFLLASVKLSKK